MKTVDEAVMRRLQRGPRTNRSGEREPFIEGLSRDFDTGRLLGCGYSSSGLSSSWFIEEPMSPYFQKLTEGLEIPPVLAKVDL